jgi:hypothetical protein
MSLNDLQSALQQQADQHQNVVTITASVIVGASLTPRDGFDGLVDNFLRIQGGLSVTISAKIPAPTDDTLSSTARSRSSDCRMPMRRSRW